MGFPGTGKIWMNGKLVDWRDANIHIGSHVVHYGSGVFEGARCYSAFSRPRSARSSGRSEQAICSAARPWRATSSISPSYRRALIFVAWEHTKLAEMLAK